MFAIFQNIFHLQSLHLNSRNTLIRFWRIILLQYFYLGDNLYWHAYKCRTMMEFKVARSIVNVLIFAGLIKIRFTLRRESTKVLLFPSTEAGRKNVTENIRSFVHPFRIVLWFSGRQWNLHIDDKVEREAPGDFDGLCEVYGMTARETLVLSPLLMHIQKLHRQ